MRSGKPPLLVHSDVSTFFKRSFGTSLVARGLAPLKRLSSIPRTLQYAYRKSRFYCCTNDAVCTGHVKELADPSY
ncbi:hypothetical protein BD311DRAFT_83590 [Dichomitus squalens]|uniref:Uncharacterized protein n=1 Tax=Dichomitus squalens TaxID=114155 RepID=A0A4Q9MAC3_9APHY|nr:hypothetical protein BD311DRAFT_83590 [Dichomitus squalens]